MTRVLWLNLNPETDARGSWDQEIVEQFTAGPDFEHEILDAARASEAPHYGAVVVIAGQHQVGYEEEIADWLVTFPWALVIVTSDEERLFPLGIFDRHDRFALWTQYHASPYADRLLPLGARPGTTQIVATLEQSDSRLFRACFAGQTTHKRRAELADQMHTMDGAFSLGTRGFARGLPHHTYLAVMAMANLAPCPSGPHSLDSFRLYESLAVGTIPIVETQTPHGPEPDYWPRLLSPDHPIPTVTSWTELAELAAKYDNPEVWKADRDAITEWWTSYRARLWYEFRDTIARLRGGSE